jgi:hypothetical protein
MHFVALAWIGYNEEGATGAKLHVSDLHAVMHPAYHNAFFAPVELECFAKGEVQRHEAMARDVGAALRCTPGANEIGHTAVTACITFLTNLLKKFAPSAPLALDAFGISNECALPLFDVRGEFASNDRALIFRCGDRFLTCRTVCINSCFTILEPALDGISRLPRSPCDFAVSQFVAHPHASNST